MLNKDVRSTFNVGLGAYDTSAIREKVVLTCTALRSKYNLSQDEELRRSARQCREGQQTGSHTHSCVLLTAVAYFELRPARRPTTEPQMTRYSQVDTVKLFVRQH
jgi:hypothetical protein